MVIECTGNANGVSQARALVRPKGTLVLKTTLPQPHPIDLSSLVVDEISLIGSRCGPFPAALRLLSQGLIDVESLITAEFPLHKGVEAFTLAQKSGVLKVLIRPDDDISYP